MIQPIQYNEIKNALRNFLIAATSLDGANVVWGRQSAPKPEYPYCTLNIIAGPTPIGIDEKCIKDNGDTTFTLTTRGERLFTLSFTAFAKQSDNDREADAHAYAAAIVAALEEDSYARHFRDAGLAVRSIIPTTLPDEQIAASWITMSVVDVVFAASSNVSRLIDPIEAATLIPNIGV